MMNYTFLLVDMTIDLIINIGVVLSCLSLNLTSYF